MPKCRIQDMQQTVVAGTSGTVIQCRLSIRLQFTVLRRAHPDRVN